MKDNWGPKETTQFFKQIEEIGLASCIRAMAFILDAGIEHLKQVETETIEAEKPVEVEMVKFSTAAKRLSKTRQTIHNWWKQGKIAGCKKTGPRTQKMPLSELERLEREM